MVLVTFQREHEDILVDGSKTQTIRRNARRWCSLAHQPDMTGNILEDDCVRLYNRSGNVLHVHLGNPRNRAPWCRRLGVSTAGWSVTLMRGEAFDDDVAARDGFAGRQELLEALMELNGMTMNEVLDHVWAVIAWDWGEGPT